MGSQRRGIATIVAESYCPTCESSFPDALERCPQDKTRLVRLTEKQDELVGTTLDGRFLLLSKLGSGGMGSVYRAEQLSIGRDVAVKVIRPSLSNDIGASKRFLREAKLASRICHGNSVNVLDYGQTSSGLLYLAMELVEGKTIDQILAVQGAMSADRVCHIARQILDALDHAHSLGIVHRDLKPSNVIVIEARDDLTKVVDFGLAKSLGGDFTTTDSCDIMGTPAYVAPEIVLGAKITHATDLYSLGVLLYEALTGRLPFEDDDMSAVLLAHAYREPPPLGPSVHFAVASFVLKLLAKKPQDRFPSAGAANEALEEIRQVAGLGNTSRWLDAETAQADALPDLDSFADEDDDGPGTTPSGKPLFVTEDLQTPLDAIPRLVSDDIAFGPTAKASAPPSRRPPRRKKKESRSIASSTPTMVPVPNSVPAVNIPPRKTQRLALIPASAMLRERGEATAEVTHHRRSEPAKQKPKLPVPPLVIVTSALLVGLGILSLIKLAL